MQIQFEEIERNATVSLTGVREVPCIFQGALCFQTIYNNQIQDLFW